MDKLPKGWKLIVFRDYYDITSSKRVFESDWTNIGVPFYRAREIVKLSQNGFVDNDLFISEEMYNLYSSKYGIPQEDDLMITGVGTLGICYVVKKEDKFYFKDGNIIWFKKKSNEIYSRFVEYAFKSDYLKKQINNNTGATVGTYTIVRAKNTNLPLPPLPEQIRIVNKLDSLFERIDKSIALLEENIKHTEALIDSSTNGVFDSLSEKYQSVPLLKYVDFIGGSQPPKSKFSNTLKDGYVRLIQIRDYKSDNFIVYIDKKSTTKFCNEDDVMIGRYGPPVFQILRGIKGAYNVALMKAVPNEEKISKDYLFYFLQNSKIQNYIISISQRSAGQSGVNKKALEMYEIVVPPLDIQQKTVDVIKELQCKLHRLLPEQQYKLSYLKALKASLLDKAFKGEL